jgi:hypothetical protein
MSDTFKLSSAEMSYLNGVQALARDARGREVLIGLTFEETAWYINSSHRLLSRHRADRQRYLELHQKHEMARAKLLDDAKPSVN